MLGVAYLIHGYEIRLVYPLAPTYTGNSSVPGGMMVFDDPRETSIPRAWQWKDNPEFLAGFNEPDLCSQSPCFPPYHGKSPAEFVNVSHVFHEPHEHRVAGKTRPHGQFVDCHGIGQAAGAAAGMSRKHTLTQADKPDIIWIVYMKRRRVYGTNYNTS